MKLRKVRRKGVVEMFIEGVTEGMSKRSVLTLGLVLLATAVILSLILVWYFSVSCSQSVNPQGQIISDTPTPKTAIIPTETISPTRTPTPKPTVTETPIPTPTPRTDGCG